MKRITYVDAKPYRKFIEARDRALDQILFKYRELASNILFHVEQTTIQKIVGMYATHQLTYRTADNEQLINALRGLFIGAIRDTWTLYKKAARQAYILSHIGEAEAIGRVKVKQTTYEASPKELEDKTLHRIRIYYERLLRKIIDKTQLATLHAKTVEEFKWYIESAFPMRSRYKRPPRALKKLTESRRVGPFILSDEEADALEEELAQEYSSTFEINQLAPKTDMSTGLVSQEDWDVIVKDYTDEHIDPLTIFGRTGETKYRMGGSELYDWELDRDLTHTFVKEVRDGQVDAANKNGVTDMVWIAILNKVTCDDCCNGSGCSDRDGLTSQEIEDKYGDPITPPAHVNCRCRLAPYDKDVDSEDYDKLPDYGDFDQWINS